VIVLDTHAWVWWVSGSQPMSRQARTALQRGMNEGSIRVSSISVWEVAQLVARGRLELTSDVADWVAKSESLPFVQFVPVDNRIAIRAARLPGRLHADPADRLIVATTLALGATLVTKDERLRRYAHVETLW
jgi:PIN domain nuclease of toxin-antitoxin system